MHGFKRLPQVPGVPGRFFILEPDRLREAVFVLAQRSGWGLNELLALEEEDLLLWLDAGKRVVAQAEKD